MESIGYVGASRVSQKEVENFPEKYVIAECLPACKILWDKNIYTFMCSDTLNENAWIEIILDNLSKENLSKIDEIRPLLKRIYSYHQGTVNFEVEGFGESAQEQLVKIANMFFFQDVPRNEAYITEEDFLISQGCYIGTPNPNYIADPFMAEEGIIDYDKVMAYMKSTDPTKDIVEFKTFDPNKVEKTTDQYVADNSNKELIYVNDEGRIYLSEFDLKKHQNYISFVQNQTEVQKQK